MNNIRLLLMVCCVVGSTFAKEHNIANTKQYKEYEAFARDLKKETDKRLQFSRDEITYNTTDVDTLVNTSIPNWKSLNVGYPSNEGKVVGNSQDKMGSVPLIFISFSMPEELIKNYITEAKLYGSVLVLRGLIGNSLKKTVMKLQEIEGIDNNSNNKKSNLSIVIHPHLFKLYDVKQVPAIVVSKDNLGCILKYDDCSTFYEYDKVYGSVTIEYALEEVKRNGSSSNLRSVAKDILLSKNKEV